MTSAELSKTEIAKLTERLLMLCAMVDEKSAAERIQTALHQYRSAVFRLVVVGEIKKGKSSFINALLGQRDLLPIMSDVATSTVFKVMDGDKKTYKVFFNPADHERPSETMPPPRELTADEVAEYGTENGNPGNRKDVDFIGVQLPNPWLRSGVVVIDTPGLGGVFAQHADITWRYMPSADAIFFILDSVEAVASKAEMEYLQRLRKLTPLLFFVQTKIDQVKPEEWQAWRDRNLAIISDALSLPEEKIMYFTVSSELKHLADEEHDPALLKDSGFIPVQHFLQQKLVKAKEERFARKLLGSLLSEAESLRRNLSDKRQILATESREGLDSLERDYNEAKSQFERWRNDQFQRTLRKFQDDSADFKRATLDELQACLDPSPNGPVVEPILEQLRASGWTAEQLVKEPKMIQSACVDRCNEQVFRVQGNYNDAMSDLITSTLQALGASSKAIAVPTSVNGVAVPLVENLNLQFSGFDATRTTFFGGTFGVTLATAIGGIFFAPASPIIAVAAMAGAIIGLFQSKKSIDTGRYEKAHGQLKSILTDIVRVAQRQALKQFNDTSTAFERAARNSFESAAADTQDKLQQKLAAIADARKTAQTDNQAKLSRLNELLDATNALTRDIRELVSQGATPVARDV